MLRKFVLVSAMLALCSLGLAQVAVEDRWRYTPFAQKDSVTAERLLRYTLAAAGERLRFEVRVDGQVVARFAKRARGEMAFVFRVRPQEERREGLTVVRNIVDYGEYGSTASVVAVVERREGARAVTTTEVVKVRAPRTLVQVALELPFANVDVPVVLDPRLALRSRLEPGRTYELVSGHWGEGHEFAVYVTPIAD